MRKKVNLVVEQSQIENDEMVNSNIYDVRKNKIRDRVYVIATIVILLISIMVLWSAYATRVFVTSEIEGYSMLPTINTTAPNNIISWDKVYINKYDKGKNGDIVVSWWTHFNDFDNTNTSVIKRIIASEGDTIAIDDSGDVTKVIVNGQIIDEPYIKSDNGGLKFSGFGTELLSRWSNNITIDADGLKILTIPQNYVFYMGDNRNGSADCRTDGPRPLNQVIGKVEYIYHAKLSNVDDGTSKILIGEKSGWWDRYWFGMGQVASYCFNWFIDLF